MYFIINFEIISGKIRIQKLKIVKNPSLFLHQCTFTMHRPRVHSISQWRNQHLRERSASPGPFIALQAFDQMDSFRIFTACDYLLHYCYFPHRWHLLVRWSTFHSAQGSSHSTSPRCSSGRRCPPSCRTSSESRRESSSRPSAKDSMRYKHAIHCLMKKVEASIHFIV